MSKTICRFLVAGCILFCLHAAMAQNIRVQSYRLDVTFSPEQHFMAGRAEIAFQESDTPFTHATFYLHGELRVDSLKVGDEAVAFSQDQVFYASDYSLVAIKVEITPEKTDLRDRLTVYYSGYFNRSTARGLSDYMRIDSEGVFLRSYGYSLWFPVFLEASQDDYPVSFPSVVIRTPEEFVSVLTGSFVKSCTEGGHRITEWRAEKTDIFNAQCTARRYQVLKENSYYVYSLKDTESLAMARKITAMTKRLDSLYTVHYRKPTGGDAQLHVMQMPRYGDISSGNVIGMSDRSWMRFDQATVFQRLLAHELVHSFVHVPVDRTNPFWVFVIEGFPSYFHLPMLGRVLGDAFYEDYMKTTEEAYLKRRETGLDRRGRSLPAEKPILAIEAEELSVFKDRFVLNDRVLLFFDFLRQRMGDSRFLAFCKALFGQEHIDYEIFKALVLEYLPDAGDDLHVWLKTTAFPDRFRIDAGP